MFSNGILRLTFLILIQRLQQHSCDEEMEIKFGEAQSLAFVIKEQFYNLFNICLETTMPNQKFLSNNINNYINYPSKTTVGYSFKFTSNRKFFANLLGTVAFKNMLERDVQELRKDLVKKMEYCDKSILDQNMLREYYDREVDLSKL